MGQLHFVGTSFSPLAKSALQPIPRHIGVQEIWHNDTVLVDGVTLHAPQEPHHQLDTGSLVCAVDAVAGTFNPRDEGKPWSFSGNLRNCSPHLSSTKLDAYKWPSGGRANRQLSRDCAGSYKISNGGNASLRWRLS